MVLVTMWGMGLRRKVVETRMVAMGLGRRAIELGRRAIELDWEEGRRMVDSRAAMIALYTFQSTDVERERKVVARHTK